MKLKTRLRIAAKVLLWGQLDLPKSKCDVVIIDEASELIHERLGITRERQTQLHNVIENKDYKTITDKMQALGKECNHANELVYGGFITHDIFKSENPLAKLFGSLFK